MMVWEEKGKQFGARNDKRQGRQFYAVACIPPVVVGIHISLFN